MTSGFLISAQRSLSLGAAIAAWHGELSWLSLKLPAALLLWQELPSPSWLREGAEPGAEEQLPALEVIPAQQQGKAASGVGRALSSGPNHQLYAN